MAVPLPAIQEVGHKQGIRVKVVYPSLEFKLKQETAVKTQAGFQEESIEHYRLMQVLVEENLLGYNKWLRMF